MEKRDYRYILEVAQNRFAYGLNVVRAGQIKESKAICTI
jgi:hypothetical protein